MDEQRNTLHACEYLRLGGRLELGQSVGIHEVVHFQKSLLTIQLVVGQGPGTCLHLIQHVFQQAPVGAQSFSYYRGQILHLPIRKHKPDRQPAQPGGQHGVQQAVEGGIHNPPVQVAVKEEDKEGKEPRCDRILPLNKGEGKKLGTQKKRHAYPWTRLKKIV